MNAPANLPAAASAETADAPVETTSKFKAVMAYSSPVVDLAFWVVIVAIVGVAMAIGGLLHY